MQSCETDGAERQQSTPRKLLDSPAGMNSGDQSQSQPAKSVYIKKKKKNQLKAYVYFSCNSTRVSSHVTHLLFAIIAYENNFE
jgi:hypothetical protein